MVNFTKLSYTFSQKNFGLGYKLAIYPKLMGDMDDVQAYSTGLDSQKNVQQLFPPPSPLTVQTTPKPLTQAPSFSNKNLQSAYARVR